MPLHAYGLCLAVGVLVAVKIAERRVRVRGFEDGLVSNLATTLVVGGVIGARVYHLFTGYKWDEKGFVGIFKIWEGGLSIWGAVAGGAIALVFATRGKGYDRIVLADALAPAVVVAQGIGRWGNYFNQELYGRPTTLPWGLEIDRPPTGYSNTTTFHPTFLYESLWCFVVFAIIVLLERKGALRRGQALTLYVALYTFERFFMELLRIDDASKILGMRFNALLSAVLCIGATIAFIAYGRRATEPSGDALTQATTN